MTSSVGTNQLELACTCFDENDYTWKEFNSNPQEFYKNHNCALTGSGCERVVCEARKFFSSDLLDSFDKVIVVEKFRNQKAIARLLLREIVREVAGRRIIVYASNAALVVLLRKASTESEPLGDEAPNYLLTVEEKETIKNQWISLQENITGVAKATSVILDAVLKTIGAPFQLPNLPARHYLFLCLDDDARMGLIDGLTESLRSSSAKSLFTHVKLDNNYCGEILRKLLIEEVKEKPCMVLFDGVEFADDLEIFDHGTLSDDEGFTVDFHKTIVILTSAGINKRAMAKLFNYREPCVLRSISMNQIVKQFRTKLLHRIDEVICFDPLLPAHGDILWRCKYVGRHTKQPHNASVIRRLFRELEEMSLLRV